MIELIFGIIWIIFFIIMFISTGAKLGSLFFILIGLYLTNLGFKKVYKDIQTKNKGEECYGRVLSVERNGTIVNNIPMYKAQIFLYSQLDGTDYTIWEDIGFDPARFPVGSFVKVLYYNGDINFNENSNSTEYIPEGLKQHLLSKTQYLLPHLEKESIIIDGVRYIKEDSINNKL